jgi:ABC-2 type transport system ATP-binding protein
MQQKIQFIGCAIHDPDVLILDEPFSGLDPVNAHALRDLFLEFRGRGKTVVLCTHVMEQAEKLCDEIVLINRSRVILEGRLADIKQRFSGNRLVIKGEGTPESLRSLRGVHAVDAQDGALSIELDAALPRSEFLRAASQVYAIDSATPHQASLDEIFIRVVGESVGEIEAASGKEVTE